jgi:hypothetical protein
MTTKNDITGDTLISKANTAQYDEGYDLIFKQVVEELHEIALSIEDAKVGHSHMSDEELCNGK